MASHNEGIPRTELDLLTTFFQDGQANNSITAQDMRDFVKSVPTLTSAAYPGIMETPVAAQLQTFTTQTAMAANTVYPIDFTVQHHIENITHSVGVNPSEITLTEDGLYNVSVGANFYKTGGGTTIIAVFLQESLLAGGGWVTTSAAVRRDVTANGVAGFASFGHIDRHVAGDKYRVAWITDDDEAALQTFAVDTPAAGFPAIPSVDFRIHRIGNL